MISMQFYSQNPNVCAAELDGEICLFNPTTAEYLNLNTTGSAIWNAINEPKSQEDIVTELLLQFEIKRDQCHEEISKFLQEAATKGLAKIS